MSCLFVAIPFIFFLMLVILDGPYIPSREPIKDEVLLDFFEAHRGVLTSTDILEPKGNHYAVDWFDENVDACEAPKELVTIFRLAGKPILNHASFCEGHLSIYFDRPVFWKDRVIEKYLKYRAPFHSDNYPILETTLSAEEFLLTAEEDSEAPENLIIYRPISEKWYLCTNIQLWPEDDWP